MGPLLQASSPVAGIDAGKGIVGRFHPFQPEPVHVRGSKLLMQGDEPEQMILHASAGVVGAGAGAQDERPVAGLGQQQFAASLFQGALIVPVGAG